MREKQLIGQLVTNNNNNNKIIKDSKSTSYIWSSKVNVLSVTVLPRRDSQLREREQSGVSTYHCQNKTAYVLF
jgi:hypothetical protein